MFENCHFVQCEGTSVKRFSVDEDVDGTSVFHDVASLRQGLEGGFDFVGRDIGKEAKSSRVDAEDGHSRQSQLRGGGEERSVSSDGDGGIGRGVFFFGTEE